MQRCDRVLLLISLLVSEVTSAGEIHDAVVFFKDALYHDIQSFTCYEKDGNLLNNFDRLDVRIQQLIHSASHLVRYEECLIESASRFKNPVNCESWNKDMGHIIEFCTRAQEIIKKYRQTFAPSCLQDLYVVFHPHNFGIGSLLGSIFETHPGAVSSSEYLIYNTLRRYDSILKQGAMVILNYLDENKCFNLTAFKHFFSITDVIQN